MSTETLNRTSVVTEVYPRKVSQKQDLSPKKVNIDVLKKRVFEEKKREPPTVAINVPLLLRFFKLCRIN